MAEDHAGRLKEMWAIVLLPFGGGTNAGGALPRARQVLRIRGMKWHGNFFISLLIFALGIIALPNPKARGASVELNTILMESTFKLEGPGSLGTGFILGRPYPNDPKKARFILVTAAHVLEGIQAEVATLVMRRKKGPDDWERLPVTLQIRSQGRILWTKHPQADVAVMYVTIPKDATLSMNLISTALLATDKTLADIEVHPGDEVSCLGYPFGAESSQAGFPILRSGKIASYPLLPTKDTRTFLLDFQVFRGNSGGPVYFVQSGRTFGGSVHVGTTLQFIIGLVSQEVTVTEQIQELYGRREQSHPLGLAKVVHASLIREAVELLPSPETLPE